MRLPALKEKREKLEKTLKSPAGKKSELKPKNKKWDNSGRNSGRGRGRGRGRGKPWGKKNHYEPYNENKTSKWPTDSHQSKEKPGYENNPTGHFRGRGRGGGRGGRGQGY